MAVTKVLAVFDGQRRKLIIGLVLAALLFTVSAAVYYALDLRKVGTGATPKVIFVSAADSTSAGATFGTNSTYAKLTSIKSYPNVTSTYELALNVSNTDTAAHNIRLSSISITGGSSSYGTILVNLVSSAGTRMGNITYTGGGAWSRSPSSGATSFVSLGNGIKWAIRIDSTLSAGTASGITTTLELVFDVS